MKNPGNAGLTVERFGDAEPWIPQENGRVDVTEEKNAGLGRVVMK
jgi:hypothetical protein